MKAGMSARTAQTASDLLSGVPTSLAIDRFTVDCPIDSVIFRQELTVQGLTRNGERYKPWWSTFQHYFLVAAFVNSLKAKPSPDETPLSRAMLDQYCRWTIESIETFRRDVIARHHPQEAQRLYTLTASTRR